MNVDDALIRLGESTSEAVAGILQMFAGDAAQPGPVTIVGQDSDPLQGLPTPAVAASVSYVDGVTGGNVFVMPLDGARALAAAMMGEAPPEDEATELTELELSAVGEAMNQMMAAAANATSAVLGTGVEIAPPDTRVVSSMADALRGQDDAAHMTSGVFTVFGRPCRLVQLVPNAFVMRMTKALDELGAEYLGDQAPTHEVDSAGLDESHARDPCARVGRARPQPDADRPAHRHARRRGGRARPPGRRARRPLRQRHALRLGPARRLRGRRVGRPDRGRRRRHRYR